MKKFLSILLAAMMVLSTAMACAEEKMTISWLADLPPLEDGSWGEKTFEETFGVDVVIKRAETADERAVLFASGDIPDFIVAGSLSNVANLVEQGIVKPYTVDFVKENMPEYYEMCTAADPSFFTYGSVDGELYGFPRYNATGAAPIAAAIRADWLQKLNLSVPKTVGELSEAFYQFTHGDPDGNGKDDTYAITAGGAATTSLQRLYFPSIFGIYGVSPFYWSENAEGQLEFGFVSEGSK